MSAHDGESAASSSAAHLKRAKSAGRREASINYHVRRSAREIVNREPQSNWSNDSSSIRGGSRSWRAAGHSKRWAEIELADKRDERARFVRLGYLRFLTRHQKPQLGFDSGRRFARVAASRLGGNLAARRSKLDYGPRAPPFGSHQSIGRVTLIWAPRNRMAPVAAGPSQMGSQRAYNELAPLLEYQFGAALVMG